MNEKISRALLSMSEKSSFAMAEKAKEFEKKSGIQVVHMEIGQPDFETPAHIKDAAVAALREGKTKYVAPLGIPELRQAIANYVSTTRGAAAAPEQVVVAPSGKTAMLMALGAVVNPGDEVIYPDPGFPSYRNIITFFGGIPRPLPLREENGFRFDIRDLERLLSPKTKMVILNFPSNPTGAVMEKESVAAVEKLLRTHDCFILSDEIYSRMVYDEAGCASMYGAQSLHDRLFLLDGFSKTYAMTGWRLGYLVAPRHLIPSLDTLAVNMYGCTAAFTQYAGVAALTGPQEEAEKMMREFKARRNAVVEGLNAIPGMACQMPGGAFYAFPNIKKFGITSEEFADRLLEKEGVSLLPGSIYGNEGEGYVRISYATSLPQIKEGLARIARFVKGIEALSQK